MFTSLTFFLVCFQKSVIPGGTCDECTYMSGILFRKTGTNKQMPREIINPKVMVSTEKFSVLVQFVPILPCHISRK